MISAVGHAAYDGDPKGELMRYEGGDGMTDAMTSCCAPSRRVDKKFSALLAKILSSEKNPNTLEKIAKWTDTLPLPPIIGAASRVPIPVVVIAAADVALLVYVATETYKLIDCIQKSKDKSASDKANPSPKQTEPPEVEYPGNDPTKPPGKDFEWRGKPGSRPGDPTGDWYNPNTGESFRPDLRRPGPQGHHWDYRPGPSSPWWRVFPDGKVLPK
jgi:hypothetical protein